MKKVWIKPELATIGVQNTTDNLPITFFKSKNHGHGHCHCHCNHGSGGHDNEFPVEPPISG
ncbi:hypothetical protein PBV87_07325 [Niameybacter massiliensis]|uniref:Uncharacterized protein n=1 Tax=Holtiella tumoricola TaxID=3018743 RepID=A0AA42DLU6_9FIRM|nr:hypothetical protein [Holtiella tumoricola]MDA3731289.1 hypothetical protein [Holtiella tumoricola]